MLKYDLTAIKNYKELCYDEEGRVKASTINIVGCLAVIDIKEITRENLAEVWTRIFLAERMLNDNTDRISLQDVVAHIGLKTNLYEHKHHAPRDRWLNEALPSFTAKLIDRADKQHQNAVLTLQWMDD
jgi:hypothetical protein